jgi:hypothetical protein
MTFAAKTPEQIAELKRLQAELPLAIKRAAEALRTYGKPLAGKLLQRAEAEEANVSCIKRKIDELSETKPT